MLSLDKLPHQHPNEKTILFFRRHWIVFIKKFFLVILMAVVPLVFYFIFQDFALDAWRNKLGRIFLVLGVSAYYLFVWLFLFIVFVDYYLDTWFITNRRIIDVEQHGLFGRTIAELKMYRVQDVTSEIKGFIPTMFNFGTVYVQTAGEEQRFVFENIPNPYGASKIILELAEKSNLKRKEENKSTIA